MDPPTNPGLSKSRVDQTAYNFTESQVATTYAGSSMAHTRTHDDESQTDISTYSYRSGVDTARYLKEAHGRTMNAVNDAYFLPTDDDEWVRLEKQHMAIVLGLGGLYPAAANIPAILRPEEGQTKRVLDLGCGTGVWTLAIAREFPHVQVLGVDLAPIPINPEDLPDNCRFEVDDINLGLDHLEGQFDFIHARLVAAGIRDFSKSMLDIERCLKPGGLILWLDADYELYSTSTFSYTRPPASELSPSGSWLQRSIYETRRSCILGGSDLRGMESALDEGFWARPLLDPETCKTAEIYIPVGPWAVGSNPMEHQYLSYVGALMRQDTKSVHRAIHPLLIRSGWSREVVNEWSEKVDEELSSLKDQMSFRVRVAWGRRRAAENEPAPILPLIEEDPDEYPRPKYPYFYVYDTYQASTARAVERDRGKPQEAPPHPADKSKPAEV